MGLVYLLVRLGMVKLNLHLKILEILVFLYWPKIRERERESERERERQGESESEREMKSRSSHRRYFVRKDVQQLY